MTEVMNPRDDLLNSSDFDDVSYMNNYEDEIDISENKLSSKVMQLQQMIIQFEYRLAGFSWSSNGDKLSYTGDVLMGTESLKRIMQLLQTFSREINMISNKDSYQWAKQLLRTTLNAIDLVTTATDVRYVDMKIIFRSFYNLLINIGHIIVNKNSQDYLKAYYNMINEQKNGVLPDMKEEKAEV